LIDDPKSIASQREHFKRLYTTVTISTAEDGAGRTNT
jgi:hypothetical protein